TSFSRDWSSDVCSSDLALTERARLMELRAELLVHRARAAGAPWLTHLEEELGTATDTVVRSSAARMVAAYRERHQVSDPLRSLRSEERRVGKERGAREA